MTESIPCKSFDWNVLGAEHSTRVQMFPLNFAPIVLPFLLEFLDTSLVMCYNAVNDSACGRRVLKG